MTKTYALKRLLEHGPMEAKDILSCTRWSHGALQGALQRCLNHGVITRRRASGNCSPCAKYEYEAAINQGA